MLSTEQEAIKYINQTRYCFVIDHSK